MSVFDRVRRVPFMSTPPDALAGGPVRLEDPQAGSGGQVFHDLLNDLHGGPAASRMCTPV